MSTPLPQLRSVREDYSDASASTLCLGCAKCEDFDICGGLSVANIRDCLSFCCGGKPDCDLVCPKNRAHFQRRLEEVGGLRTRILVKRTGMAAFPDVIPLIPDPSRLSSPFSDPAAVPLVRLLSRLDLSTADLRHSLGVAPSTAVLAHGVGKDADIEPLWRSYREPVFLQCLENLRPVAVTIPNFSVVQDVPRHDNLHALRRIQRFGAQVAELDIEPVFHVHGRTKHDYEAWASFYNANGCRSLCVEFRTLRTAKKQNRHLDWLKSFAEHVSHELRIFVRGYGTATQFRDIFDSVTIIDTTSLIKSRHGKRAVFDGEKVRWFPNAVAPRQPVDDLFRQNIEAQRTAYSAMFVGSKT